MTILNDLESLRTFVLVVEAGSLSAAARLLQVSTNAVSRRVMRLEASLGVKVLRRSTRAVSVTSEGRTLYRHAQRAIEELTAAEQDLLGSRAAVQGPISVALPGGACSASVLKGISGMLRTHADLQLEIHVVNGEVDPVAAGFDVVLHVGPLKDSRLVARRLLGVSWCLAAAPEYFADRPRPKLPADLAQHVCLRLATNPPQDEWQLMDREGHVHRISVTGNFVADDSRVLGDATYAGLGIGVRPEKELARAVKAGALVAVLPGCRFATLDLYALMPKGASRLARVRKFLDVFAEVLREQA